MTKYIVFVEGKADAAFLRDCLLYLFENKSIRVEKDESKDKILLTENTEIKINVVEGFAAQNLKTRIETASKKGIKTMVVLDADSQKKDHKFGGYERRINYLNHFKKENNIEFDVFLFPNNQEDGDLETLLLQIAHPEKYKPYFDCYEKYIHCLQTIADEQFSNELFEDKNKIYSYMRAYYGMQNAKEENRKYTPEFWNFTHKAILPFFDFIKKMIVL